MYRPIFSTAVVCVPLVLAACVAEDDLGNTDGMDSLGTSSGMTTDNMTTEGTTSEGMTTEGMTTEGMTTEGETDTDTAGDGCDAESPYMGGWDIGCCQDEIVQNGWSPGQVGAGTILPDWTMNSQFGDAVRLYDFCHDAVYFEYSAVW